jgi:spore maturation protein SpmA
MKAKESPINIIFLFMVVVSVAVAGFNGKMDALNIAIFDSAKAAVVLAIGLIGPMALWLGVMFVLEKAGLLNIVALKLQPVLSKLFPSIPANHPAMSAIIMNLAANMLGLGNAATPMGIKAMQEMEKLAPEKGTASDDMILFLAINTSSVTLLPLGVITIRASAGTVNPASIILPALATTICTTAIAIIATKFLARKNKMLSVVSDEEMKRIEILENSTEKSVFSPILIALILAIIASLGYSIYNHIINNGFSFGEQAFVAATTYLVPLLLAGFLLFGALHKKPVYEVLAEGAKGGFDTAVRMIPYMVAIFVAIGMVRASGTLDIVNAVLSPVLNLIGMPTEALSVGIMRPLSGSGSFALMSEIINNNPNSFLADLVSVMQGSTETTFYVLAVYFGAAGVIRTRYAVPAALSADIAGILLSLFFTRLFL